LLLGLDQFVDQGRGGGEAYTPLLTAGSDAESGQQVSLAGAAIADQDHRLDTFDISSLRQLVDLGGPDLRCFSEVELIQSFDPWQMRLLDAAGYSVAFAFFQLRSQQRFQVAQIGLSLLNGLFCQRSTLLGHGWQSQGTTLLLHCGLLQVLHHGLHACTSRRSWS
jgi:hypothetical protein